MANYPLPILIVGEKNVELLTDVDYVAIKFDYKERLAIVNKLPNGYMIKKTDSRIIILNVSSDIKAEVLFEYRGACRIYEGTLYDRNHAKYPVQIVRTGLQMWGDLGVSPLRFAMGAVKRVTGSNALPSESLKWSTWATKYVDISFMGNNLRTSRNVIQYSRTSLDNRREPSTTKLYYNEVVRGDVGMDIVGNQEAGSSCYVLEDGTPYSGKFNYNIRTKTMMTGEVFGDDSVELFTRVIYEKKKNLRKSLRPKKVVVRRIETANGTVYKADRSIGDINGNR